MIAQPCRRLLATLPALSPLHTPSILLPPRAVAGLAAGLGQWRWKSTVNTDELGKFARLADSWWEPGGPFRALHALNPMRVAFIEEQARLHFGIADETSLSTLSVLDVGCGGGILAEALAERGAYVHGIDASAEGVGAALAHRELADATVKERLRYTQTTTEVLAGESTLEQHDLVVASEVIEHVARPALFVRQCAALVKPGGALVVTTMNRTAKALLLAVFVAENILNLAPRGTHDASKFITPAEMQHYLVRSGMKPVTMAGLSYDLSGQWTRTEDLSVNYMVFAAKAALAE